MGDDANFVHLMNHQLALWANQAPAPAPASAGGDGEEGVLMPQEVLAVYRLLGSEPFPSDLWGAAPDNPPGAGNGSLLSGLGWARGLAVLFWYCSCALASGPDGTPGACHAPLRPFPAPLQPLCSAPLPCCWGTI